MLNPNAREQYCRELAKRMAEEDGPRLARLLQMTGFLHPHQKTEISSPPSSGGPKPISIWMPREKEDKLEFVRPEAGPFVDHYADRVAIPATKPEHTKRVLWFGESAAAGYLYAPVYTPAKVLAHNLAAMVPETPWEVIDLARTNEHLQSLTETVEASLQLDPDLLAIYTGNNWNLLETPEHSAYAPDITARQAYGACLREGGFTAAIDRAGKTLLHKAHQAMETILGLALQRDIPLVLVVPEVNLADWTSLQPPVWLPALNLAAWYETRQKVLAALNHEDWQGVKAGAFALLEIDEGTCPTTFRFLARAHLGLGDIPAAREAARAEVDSAYRATLCFIDAPRSTSLVQKVLRRFGQRDGVHLVDLPALFHQEEALPGRDWFLDYCHLNAAGIQCAMKATAESIVQALGQCIANEAPSSPPPPEVEAVALTGAAIHLAHRLKSDDKQALMEYYLDGALAAAPEVAEAMMDLISVRLGPVPAVLHAVQQRNAASSFPLSPQHGWKYPYLDIEAILAIEASLARHQPEKSQEISRMLMSERGLGEQWQELVPYYLWEPVAQVYTDLLETTDLPGRAFYRAPFPETAICLITDGRQDLELAVVTRLPDPLDEGQRFGRVALHLNGILLAEYFAGDSWERVEIPVPSNRLQAGVNRLTIHWPIPQTPGDAAREYLMKALEEGCEAAIHPIFGEIFSIKARSLF